VLRLLFATMAISITPPPTTCHAAPPTIAERGDANLDGALNLTDPVHILFHLFAGRPLACAEAADCNHDGVVDLSDVVRFLEWQFEGGAPMLPGVAVCP